MSDLLKKRNRYPAAFKKDTVHQFHASGKSVGVFAGETGIEQSVLYRWIKRYPVKDNQNSDAENGYVFSGADEIGELKKEVATLRQSVNTLRSIIEKRFHARYCSEKVNIFDTVGVD